MQAAGGETPFTWNYLAGSDFKSSLLYPNGLTASWTYGNRGELLEVDNALSDGSVSKYVYTYDAAGRRIGCDKSGSAFTTPDTYAYLYIVRSELTNATAEVDAAYRYGYDFDDIGNRRSSVERRTQSAEDTANNLNQYTAVEAFVPQYDADGNQTLVKTATGTWQVTYNGENRPILWTCLELNNQTNQTISMSFDRMGRRVTKNGQRFVYDGYLQIADNVGNAYVWDCTEPVATRPLVWTKNDISSYYAFDGNKNVSEVIAADGSLAAHYEYAPFGAVTVSRGTSAATNSFRFSSEYAEDDTATVYYNYRHYEPVMGRLLGRDPVGESASNNLVLYVENKTLTQIDQLGMTPIMGTSITGQTYYYGDVDDHERALTYISDSPGFDGTELFSRATHWGYIDLNDENDFDPNSKAEGCACIKKIIVIAHGEKYAKGKLRVTWGSTQLYEGAEGTVYSDITEVSDNFKNIRFCQECKIDIRTCYLGTIKGFAKRVKMNSKILNDKVRENFPGCVVRVYTGLVDVWGEFGGPKEY